MKKNFLSIIFVLSLFAVPIYIALSPSGGFNIVENRANTVFPEFPTTITQDSVKQYFAQIDNYVSDYFPRRDKLIKNYARMVAAFGENVDINNAYAGHDEWLFAGNSFARTIEKLVGSYTLTDKQVEERATELAAYVSAFTEHNAKAIFVIGPNKSTIYPENLPDMFQPAERRFVEPVLTRLREKNVPLYDPTQDLIAAKADHIIYFRTDTHWNAIAGSIVTQHILDFFGVANPNAFILEPSDPIGGDLMNVGLFNITPREGDNFKFVWKDPDANQVEINEGDGEFKPFEANSADIPRGQILRNPNAPNDAILWFVGDSFTAVLRPFFAATFKEVRLLHYHDYSPEQLNALIEQSSDKPNYGIVLFVERHI